MMATVGPEPGWFRRAVTQLQEATDPAISGRCFQLTSESQELLISASDEQLDALSPAPLAQPWLHLVLCPAPAQLDFDFDRTIPTIEGRLDAFRDLLYTTHPRLGSPQLSVKIVSEDGTERLDATQAEIAAAAARGADLVLLEGECARNIIGSLRSLPFFQKDPDGGHATQTATNAELLFGKVVHRRLAVVVSFNANSSRCRCRFELGISRRKPRVVTVQQSEAAEEEAAVEAAGSDGDGGGGGVVAGEAAEEAATDAAGSSGGGGGDTLAASVQPHCFGPEKHTDRDAHVAALRYLHEVIVSAFVSGAAGSGTKPVIEHYSFSDSNLVLGGGGASVTLLGERSESAYQVGPSAAWLYTFPAVEVVSARVTHVSHLFALGATQLVPLEADSSNLADSELSVAAVRQAAQWRRDLAGPLPACVEVKAALESLVIDVLNELAPVIISTLVAYRASFSAKSQAKSKRAFIRMGVVEEDGTVLRSLTLEVDLAEITDYEGVDGHGFSHAACVNDLDSISETRIQSHL